MVLQVAVTLAIALALVVPTGRYLYRVFGGPGPAPLDRLFLPVERTIYRLLGVRDPDRSMNWKEYGLALLVSNGVMMAVAYLILRLQGLLPGNPQGIGGMEPGLAFNTASSFITNTNLQHYAGETGLSYLAQMAVITFLMFTSAASGFVTAIAFIRGIAGRALGNFWADSTRFILRVLLPAALVVTLFLTWQGVPQTLGASQTATTLEGASQTIALGPRLIC